jgi:CTD small phosphatase-like protein 2
MKTIVFDMDETLLHCKDHTDLPKYPNYIYDHVVKFKIPDPQTGEMKNNVTAYLKFRPYMHKMLKKLSQNFELILYSSGNMHYGQAVMEYVETRKNRYF